MSTEQLESGYIPSKLNAPAKFIWWTMDVVIVTVVPIYFLGILLKMPITGFALGLGMGYLFSRLKSRTHPNFLMHLWYWAMPSGVLGIKTKSLPESHKRNYIA